MTTAFLHDGAALFSCPLAPFVWCSNNFLLELEGDIVLIVVFALKDNVVFITLKIHRRVHDLVVWLCLKGSFSHGKHAQTFVFWLSNSASSAVLHIILLESDHVPLLGHIAGNILFGVVASWSEASDEANSTNEGAGTEEDQQSYGSVDVWKLAFLILSSISISDRSWQFLLLGQGWLFKQVGHLF